MPRSLHPARPIGLALLLMLLSILVPCAASAVSNTVTERTVAISGTDMSISIPPEWTVSRAVDGASFVVRAPLATEETPPAEPGARDRARPAIAIATRVMAPGETQAGLVYDGYKDLDRLLTRFHPLDDCNFGSLMLGGRGWQRIHYTFEVGQIAWEQELFITSSARTLVFITCSCDQEHYAAHRADFLAALTAMGGIRPVLEP